MIYKNEFQVFISIEITIFLLAKTCYLYIKNKNYIGRFFSTKQPKSTILNWLLFNDYYLHITKCFLASSSFSNYILNIFCISDLIGLSGYFVRNKTPLQRVTWCGRWILRIIWIWLLSTNVYVSRKWRGIEAMITTEVTHYRHIWHETWHIFWIKGII